MRDCVFLVADGHMKAVFATFLARERFFDSLGCARFHFRQEQDLKVAGNDPLVHQHAHDLLRFFNASHRRAVIVLDMEFGHQLQASEVESNITRNMIGVGWPRDRFEVIVIQPELEAWIWQDSPHVEAVFYRNRKSSPGMPLRQWLLEQRLWPQGALKPPDPKEAVLRAARAFAAGNQLVIYQEICRRVSVQRCQDPSFAKLREALRRWFPAGPCGEG